MNLADIVVSIIAVGDKIDVLWNIFIAVHFGMFTLYYVTFCGSYVLAWFDRIVTSISYAVFLYLNGNALSVWPKKS